MSDTISHPEEPTQQPPLGIYVIAVCPYFDRPTVLAANPPGVEEIGYCEDSIIDAIDVSHPIHLDDGSTVMGGILTLEGCFDEDGGIVKEKWRKPTALELESARIGAWIDPSRIREQKEDTNYSKTAEWFNTLAS